MPVTTLGGRQIHVNDEGFLTDPHWKAINFLRDDFAVKGETPTIRRVSAAGGIPVKDLFKLFPGKPAKKMAYIAGLPKPHGCV